MIIIGARGCCQQRALDKASRKQTHPAPLRGNNWTGRLEQELKGAGPVHQICSEPTIAEELAHISVRDQGVGAITSISTGPAMSVTP